MAFKSANIAPLSTNNIDTAEQELSSLAGPLARPFSSLKTSQLFSNSPSDAGILSPVTDLAINLNCLSTKSTYTPKRRISWSSDTPVKPIFTINDYSSDSPFYTDSPTFENRLLKSVNFNKTRTNNGAENSLPVKTDSGSSPTSSGSALNIHRPPIRRIRSLPGRRATVTQLVSLEKENVTPPLIEEDSDDVAEHPKEIGEELEVSFAYNGDSQGSPISSSPLGIRRFGIRNNSITSLIGDQDSQDSGCILANADGSSLYSPRAKLRTNSFPEPIRAPPRKFHLDSVDSYRLQRGSTSIFTDSEDHDDDGFLEEFQSQESPEEFDSWCKKYPDLLTQPIVNFTPSEGNSNYDEKNHFKTSDELLLQDPPSPRSVLLCQNRSRIGRSYSMLDSPTIYESKWSSEESENSGTSNQESITAQNLFTASRKRIFTGDYGKLAFKRPEPPGEASFLLESKRRKSVSSLLAARRIETLNADSPISTGPMLSLIVKRSPIQRSQSMSDVHIDSALRRSEIEGNLTGDYTVCNTLPILKGRHPDLKTISADTLRDLVSGKFTGVQSFTVVDCRYPYEFLGGHIQGAKNIYTREKLFEQFLVEVVKASNFKTLEAEGKETNKDVLSSRNVLIFHCEFSSERGPTMYRFLRKKDREVNKDNYPNLFYPEIYLLEGGYKNFFSHYKDLCEPQEYLPMNHKDHKQDLTHFRAKSKSWNNDSKMRTSFRPGLKF